ncbi:putative mitochondrial import inner membrane translocase subunit [Scheffersomyces amazonensis]|uniref:putative mitochondrial import inner membrane translocase subunit n=1 Tax=Scheffersomyces amazonensis TaxID=1078765 RepID=UPI00315CBB74
MFGLGGSTPQVSSQQKLQAAEAELDMVTGMFNQLVNQCHKKCINASYYESDITKQEALCLDRCVAKYFETNVQVGDNMQKLGQSGALMGRQ